MVLVTGATGMLGSHLMVKLLEENESVIALKRKSSSLKNTEKIFSYYNKQNLFENINWIDCELYDTIGLEDVLDRVDTVYHCAAMVSFDKKQRDRLFATNVDGTRYLVDACIDKNISRFCFVSSIGALGKEEDGKIITEESERDLLEACSDYSLTKYMSEMEVWRGFEEGLKGVIVNPSVILGEGNWNLGSASIFSSVANGMKYYTKGTTGYVDVQDVVRAMILLTNSETNAQRYILNSDNISYQDLFIRIAFEFGVKAPWKYATENLCSIAWRLDFIMSKIMGKPRKFTKNMARSSHNISSYSSEKIKNDFSFLFNSIESSISRIVKNYKLDNLD
ncbi:MAG: NAD-dependent epimerase/dehydratase family protein [Marinifilaceae bacterium]|jgi:nucleoside-diphosphate-sugar epimerase|nr:NAD-dependent epimerase/dehydratase family protein [Marinifilaceae bacterium]